MKAINFKTHKTQQTDTLPLLHRAYILEWQEPFEKKGNIHLRTILRGFDSQKDLEVFKQELMNKK